jgi:monofunctional biosynthetic peptidoglycan transglycosylase
MRDLSQKKTIFQQIKIKIFPILAKLILFCLIITLLITLPLRWFNPPYTAYEYHANLSGDNYQNLQQTWVAFSAMPAKLPLAVMAGEDQRFIAHSGIDVTEVRNAIRDYRQGSNLRGASTLTQQLAKNIYLWPGRSVTRKGIEAWLALALEVVLPKKRILELYLNTAQFSRAYFGAEASSQYLFKQSLHTISDEQAAFLAACLPAPAACRPNNQSAAHKKRQAFILKHMPLLKKQFTLLL